MWSSMRPAEQVLFDRKVNINPMSGGHLVDYMSREKVEDLISYSDQLYLDFGATEEVLAPI